MWHRLVVEANSWRGPEIPAGGRFLYQYGLESEFREPEISFHSKVIIESRILISNSLKIFCDLRQGNCTQLTLRITCTLWQEISMLRLMSLKSFVELTHTVSCITGIVLIWGNTSKPHLKK